MGRGLGERLAGRLKTLGLPDWLGLLVLFIALVLPLFSHQSLGTTVTLGRFAEIGSFVLLYLILAQGLNIVVGFTGLLDLGYVTFVIVGSYTTALLYAHPFWHREGGFLIVLLIAALHCVFWGLARGLPTLRLSGDYYAIVTFAFAEIVFLFILNEVWLTGGPMGIRSGTGLGEYPPIQLFGRPLYEDTPGFYYLVFVAVLGALFVAHRLQFSRVGRAWFAIKQDEISAASCGVDVRRFKMLAFGVSAFLGGIGGGLMAFKFGIVSPNSYDFWVSVLVLCCVVLGGMGSVPGVIVGTAVLMSLGELLREDVTLFGATFSVPDQARYLVYGVVLVLIMIFRPQGILPLGAFRARRDPEELREKARRPSPLYGLGGRAAGTERRRQGAPLLEIRGLSKHFGGVKAVDEVTFTLRRGAITALIGPNGAGKSTLFNVITGLIPPTEGEVVFHGTRGEAVLTELEAHQIARLGLARTFQNIRLFADLTLLDNVKVGLHVLTRTGPAGAILRPPRVRREAEAVEVAALRYLDFVGLLDKADDLAGNLAYGEQRRLEIARALAAGPELLLLDEPAAGMNPQETADLMELIRRIDEAGVTVLLIEHDMKMVMSISEHVAVLDYGRKIADGTPSEVARDELVIEAYLGVEHE